MLKLFIQEQQIDLPVNINIQLNLKNPMFNQIGSHSLSFELPLTPKNQIALTYPHRLTLANKKTVLFRNSLLQFNSLKFYGTIILRSCTNQKATVNMVIYEGEFYNLIKNTLLPDVDYGDIIEIGDNTTEVIAHANDTVTKDYPETKYNFPSIYNPDFYDNKNTSWANYNLVNTWDEVGNTFRRNTIVNPDTKYGESNLVPYFYLMEIIEKVCSFLGYRSGGNFLRHAELQKLLVHNNYALDKSDIAYQCYVQRNVNQTIPIGGQRINFLTENYDDGNAFDLTTDTYTIKAPGEHEVKLAVYIYDGPAQMIEVSVVCQNGTYNHVETFSYPGAVSHQFTHTFFATDADVDSSVTFYAAVRGLNNQEFIMSNSWLRVANLTSGRLNIFEQFIDMKNHVPNITAGTFFNALYQMFFMRGFVIPDQYEIEFRFLKDVLSDPDSIDISHLTDDKHEVLELTETVKSIVYDNVEVKNFSENEFLGFYNTRYVFPSPSKEGLIAIEKRTNAVFISKWSDTFQTVTWSYYTDYFGMLTYDDEGTQEITIAAGLIPIAYSYMYGLLNERGTSPMYPTGKNGTSLLLGFWRGVQTYPCISSTHYDIAGNSIGNISLALDQDDGLVESFGKEWLYWLNNKAEKIQKNIFFQESHLKGFRFDKKYRIKNVNFFISEITVELTKNRIKQAQCVLLKV